ncbi:MAG: SWIM zinc finger family protein [Oscillospiraceae bacterium]|nr:SWIM zinc finger family protein [Oscillospiraceae bacterium]
MKSILGFSVGEPPEETPAAAQAESAEPVRSLVSVSFPDDGRTLTYYNDGFALEPGDRVFVEGKLAGRVGVVEKVCEKFRIRPSDYKKVVSVANAVLRGTYEAVLDMMVARGGDAMSPEEFRATVLPPRSGEDELLVGDGFELDLNDPASAEEADRASIDRAIEYCRGNRVAYVAVRGGAGTAYVRGTKWYEVGFTLDGDRVAGMYCDCPRPGLCKHLLAVAFTVGALVKLGGVDPRADFSAVESGCFWSMAAHRAKKVTL